MVDFAVQVAYRASTALRRGHGLRKGRTHMGDASSGHSAGDGHRRGRQSTAGSSVLTPPTGIPVIPDLETSLPVQRRSSPPIHAEPVPAEPVPAEPTPADTPPPPAQRTVVDPCVCGHSQEAHEHYRPGSDCSACGRAGCGEYRPANSAWRRFLRRTGLSH
jgi:hypothetical protein